MTSDALIKFLLTAATAGVWTIVVLAFRAGGLLHQLEPAAENAARVPSIETAVAVHESRLDGHDEAIGQLRAAAAARTVPA